MIRTDEEATAAFLKEQDEVIGDSEVAHGRADQFLIDHLRTNGFPKLAAAFDKASEDFWYA